MNSNKKLFFFKHILLLIICAFIFNFCSSKKTDNDFTFVFMTDIHIQDKKDAINGFEKAVNMTNMLNVDFVITGGDLIWDALESSFEAAKTQYDLFLGICSKFKMPVYHTIGNHELFGVYKSSGIVQTHPEYGKKMFKKRVGNGRAHYSFDHKGWHFIILDTIFITPERKYTGKVDPIQLEWLKEDLKKLNKNTPIIVSTHIPLVSFSELLTCKTKLKLPRPRTIENRGEVLPLFNGYNLKLVLQGHLHILEEMVSDNIYFITGGAVCGNWWEGPRGNAEEGFVEVKIKGDSFTWEYIDIGWEAKKSN